MINQPFTVPKVVKYDDLNKSWYVFFRYNRQLFRFKFGINYIKNYNKRLAEANAKILAGMDLDALRELYGHTSKLMTTKYATVVKEVYRKQIMENSPDY